MKISENHIKRLKILSGIISEDIKLMADSGRSDQETLSWFIEEYLLNLGSKIINNLDRKIEQDPNLNLFLLRSSSKISENSITTKLIVKGKVKEKDIKEEFIFSLMVNFENSSNTTASISNKGVNNNFTLNSKHSNKDLDLFIDSVSNYFLNSVALNQKLKQN